jgi:signal transduction histidine kinase
MAGILSACPREAIVPARTARRAMPGLTTFLEALRRSPIASFVAAMHVCGLAAVLEGDAASVIVLTSGTALAMAVLVGSGGRHSGMLAAAPSDDIPSAAPRARAPAAGPAASGLPPARRHLDAHGGAAADLMARVSHELRTPLNAVIGFSDLMGQGVFGPMGHPRYAEYVRHIQESGRELLKATEDTLVLTALLATPEAAVSRAALDVRSLATDAWACLSDRAGAQRLELVVDAEPGLAIVADARVLRQALINVFGEATSRAANGSAIVFSTASAGDRIVIEIAVPKPKATGHVEISSLPLCLARALFEFESASLVCAHADGRWRAATVLEAAVQQDFFAVPSRG